MSTLKLVRALRSVLGCTLLVLAAAAPLGARTMYLSPSGDDGAAAADGAEFRSLSVAVARLAPGDTLIVREGTYDGGVTLSLKSTPGAPTVIRGQSLGAIVKGSSADMPDAFRVQDCSQVRVEGLTFRDAARAGLAVRFSDHVTVTGCLCADNQVWGIFTSFTNDIVFEKNECCRSREQHGIYHSNSGDRFVIRGNLVHDNAGNGLHMNGDPEIAGGDGVLNNGLVEDNIIYGNGQAGGAGINMTHVHDVIVRNNLVYNNYAAGITIYQDTGTFEQGSKRVLVMGNTVIFRHGQGRACINVQTTSEKVLIEGNIFITGDQRGTLQMDTEHLSSVICDRNLHWGSDESDLVTRNDNRISLATWRGLSGNDLHSVLADPHFVSPDSADYELAEGSPAVDLGLPRDSVRAGLERLGGCEWLIGCLDTLPDKDIRGTLRPVGAAPDAGAYELGMNQSQRMDYDGDGAPTLRDALALARLMLQGRLDGRLDFNADGRVGLLDVLDLLLELRKPTVTAMFLAARN